MPAPDESKRRMCTGPAIQANGRRRWHARTFCAYVPEDFPRRTGMASGSATAGRTAAEGASPDGAAASRLPRDAAAAFLTGPLPAQAAGTLTD